MAGMTDADLLRENGRLRKRVEEWERERRAARGDVLEEAAKVVETFIPTGDDLVSSVSRSSLRHSAFALRYLKTTQPEAKP